MPSLGRCVVFAGVLLITSGAVAQVPQPRFYAPLDEHARGLLMPQGFALEASAEFQPAPGLVGGGCALTPAGLAFGLESFLANQEGSVAVWLKINWDPGEVATRMLIDLGRFASLRRWQGQQYLTYTLWYHHLDEQHDYGCSAPLAGWGPGQWHHVVITWSWSARRRAIYLDGELVKQSPIARPPNVITKVQIGPDAEVADELCIYRAEIDAQEVRRLYQAGRSGQPAFAVGPIPEALGALRLLPACTAPRPPEFVNWSLQGAERRDNGMRGEVTLHGVWRWQRGQSPYEPPDDGAWLYRKVPALSSYANSFPVRDAAGKTLGASDPRLGTQNLNELPQWVEREFTPPPDWAERRLLLKIDSLVRTSAVWLNGELLGTVGENNLGGEWDITDRTVRDGANRLTIFCRGTDGDISLLGLPSGPVIEDAWLETSWRQHAVTAHVRVRSPQAQQVTLMVTISDDDGGTVVKRLQQTSELSAGGSELPLQAPWPDALAWSLSSPHLYQYVVRLSDAAGAVLDETMPRRFGFREIWIEGGQFMLNGRPVHFFGHSNAHMTSAAELGDPGYLRYSLQRWRAAGVNAVTPWQGASRCPTLHPLLDLADELGFAIFPVPWLPTGTYEGETPRRRAEWESLHQRYVERYRQHPSVLGWVIQGRSHPLDFCPAALDGHLNLNQDPSGGFTRMARFVHQIDPTRPVFGISTGDLGDVWTSMAYQGFDVDLQERENWPLRWAQRRHKPLMPCEFSLPYFRDWFARSARRAGSAHVNPQGTQALATEYGAMYLGSEVYLQEPEEYLASLQSSPGNPKASRAFWRTKLLFADTLRAWRAWGISFIYHAEVPDFFAGAWIDPLTVGGRDPRRFGATPESLAGSLQAREEMSEFGTRVAAATAPLMAFIGGPDGRFTLKDHCFWAGEQVRKALVVVNDTDGTVRLQADWSLRDAGGAEVRGGQLTLSVPPGRQEIERGQIEFTAPEVGERTDYALSVQARSEDGSVVPVPELAITVFPRAAPQPPDPAGLVLFDPVGATTDALQRLGLHVTPMPERLRASDRLIIGREALSDAAARERLAAAGLDQAVTAGMRVLVFEQRPTSWEGMLMGLRLKRIATRHCFVRAPGHPALTGLAASDLCYLRGDSDVLAPYEEPDPATEVYPEHFWHWGNDNIVATHTIEKPQVGAACAVLDCGFDLAEAALLEVRRGEGALVFCQVDVTNRVGTDPVSTRLTCNLLRWLVEAALPPPAPGLSELARQHPPTGRFEGYVAAPPPLPGIHAGDLFWREKLTVPAFEEGAGAPLFARAQQGGRELWLCSLSPEVLPSAWQRAKLGRIEAALRLMNGERTTEGPTLAEGDDAQRLYPHNWRRIPTMSEDFDPYTYWRW